MRVRKLIAAGALSISIIGSAIAGGCSAAPPPLPGKPDKPAAASAPAFDPCKDSPAPKKAYSGILSTIKCEQDLFLTMADVAGDLNVECDYCHISDKNSDPKKFNFPVMTDRKQTALFMHHVFVKGLKQKDGKEMSCASCHVDKDGKPAAKFLGEPRDVGYAMEWMNLVMVNKFTHLDGTKLKCKDCHVGNFGTPDFHKQVIMKADQIKLPRVPPFNPFPDNPPVDAIPAPVKPNTKPAGKPPFVPGGKPR